MTRHVKVALWRLVRVETRHDQKVFAALMFVVAAATFRYLTS